MSEPRMVWFKSGSGSFTTGVWWKKDGAGIRGDNIQPVLLPVGADASLVSLFRALPPKAKP